MSKVVIVNEDGTEQDITKAVTGAVMSATQPREPGQETANRSTITTADRGDVFHQNQDVQAKANQALRDKMDSLLIKQAEALSGINVTEARSLAESHDRRRASDGTFDRAMDTIVLGRTERDYSDAEDDENRRQNTDAMAERQTNLSTFNQDDIVTIGLANMLKSSDESISKAALLILQSKE